MKKAIMISFLSIFVSLASSQAQNVSYTCQHPKQLIRVYQKLIQNKYKELRPDCSTKVAIKTLGDAKLNFKESIFTVLDETKTELITRFDYDQARVLSSVSTTYPKDDQDGVKLSLSGSRAYEVSSTQCPQLRGGQYSGLGTIITIKATCKDPETGEVTKLTVVSDPHNGFDYEASNFTFDTN